MGAWGIEAWENDSAADWFEEMFEKTGLVEHLKETLSLDVHEYHDEIRATVLMITSLGQPEIWPIGQFQKLVNLGATRLQEILDENIFETHQMTVTINRELAQLNKLSSDRKVE